mgnify:CR=1 FL=1
MSIDEIKARIQGIQPNIKPIASPSKEVKGNDSFGQFLSEAVGQVNQMQKHADRQIAGLVTGKDGVTVHGAMIALEKADITFQLMNQIRGKLVQAYQELMRQQL